ncbi:hypothetical protein QEG73_10600 [Chitinophagaceae bacterium 26-R-25]|nr:hypothetical protein [Chitinophagaceae bacterium 26-R-25]
MITLSVVIPHAYAIARTQATYYVDPINGNDADNSGTSLRSAFRTIGKARDVVRTINSNMRGDIYVYLRRGTYQLASTLTFTERDRGTNGYNIIYSAFQNEKPIISGGKQITGWSLYDASQNIYRAYAGNIETRQLYVNGVRATRARSTVTPSPLTFVKAIGYTASGSIFVNNAKPMDQWKNQHDIEFVYDVVFTAPREELDSIIHNDSTTTFKMKQPGWGFVTNRGGTSLSQKYLPWYVENAYELLDAEGEWYLDRASDFLYYKPKAGEDMVTSEVIAPVVEELLRIQGSDSVHKAGNIQFYGIAFRHATWLRPNTYGQTDAQNNVIREATTLGGSGEQIIGAAVNLKNAHFVKFESDVFEKLGGSGLNMYAGCQDNLIVGSRFSDISGEGIQIGDYLNYQSPTSENYANTSDSLVILRNNDISNNYLANCGAEYFSASAIGAAFPVDMDIKHNEISGMPYSGIHIGWGWGSLTTVIKNVTVQNNYIHEMNTVLRDGGGIYTNGLTSGSATLKAGYFSENYIVNVAHTPGYAMYNDEAANGNTWYEWKKNVINTASSYAFQWRNSNNSWDSTYTNVKACGVNTKINSVTNTTVVSGSWPDAAQRIIDSAGLQHPYIEALKPRSTSVQ